MNVTRYNNGLLITGFAKSDELLNYLTNLVSATS
jgi:hypothetical protein